MRLQYRNGFYYAALFVAVIWIVIMLQFPKEIMRFQLPVLILSNLLITTFYFVSGLVLLEKREGTLSAQVVTPLRPKEYLASKIISLSLLALAEAFALVIFGFGLDVDLVLLFGGLAFTATQFILFGFITVVRYDSINEYLFPSFLYTMLLVPPFLAYYDVFNHWLIYLHPLQAPLLLTKAAFLPVADWQLIYGLIGSHLWVILIFIWGKRAFRKFIIAAEGAH